MTSDYPAQLLPHDTFNLCCSIGWDAQAEDVLDLDMAVLAIAANGTLAEGKEGFIYAGHPRHRTGAIQLLNDNVTGEGDGDDEQMVVYLPKLPPEVMKLQFVVSIDCGEEESQDFSQLHNAFWRIEEMGSSEALFRCSLSNPEWDGVTTLFLATLERSDRQWTFVPQLKVSPQQNLNALLKQYLQG